MSLPQARMAAGNAPVPEGPEGTADETSAAGPFVINLCSSTTPMALAHPDSPELKRFSFFVSRRREDNRERFRLHMGYFGTLAEAEEWLSVVRDVYPGAWAGEAPGKKLRARVAAAALAGQLPPPPTVATPASDRAAGAPQVTATVDAPVGASAVPAVARAAMPSPAELNVPTLKAAPDVPAAQGDAAAPVRPSASPSASAPRARAQTPPSRSRAVAQGAAPASRLPTPTLTSAASPLPSPGAGVTVAAAAQQPANVTTTKPPVPDVLTASNVREVMAALDDADETRRMQAPPALRGSSPAEPAPAVRARPDASLSDTQVLKILEHRRSDEDARTSGDAAGISLLKPDDTATRLALKEAVRENAPVSFAVQLCWSVQPIVLEDVPPLAIFSAYTLYTVEGSREGRKWHGLRLGFFSDAISAKQVAYYVRSEFTSVAVVPVSPRERTRAADEENKAATAAVRQLRQGQKTEEFKLFDDEPPATPAPAAAAPAKPVGRPPAGAVKKNKPLGRVRAREQRSTKTLEETLEILGASELEIDTGRGEVLNDTGVRHLRVEVQKNTPFAKLLDRLSERVRKS